MPPSPLAPSACLGAFLFSANARREEIPPARLQDLEEEPGEDISRPRPSLPPDVKDFQFRHEHFHLFESDEAFPHFGSIYLRQIVWLK